MTSYIDYTSPTIQFSYDLSNNTTFKKDACNYINTLSIMQLNTLDNIFLLDIYLSTANVVEPHYHQNAAELVYCITGAVVVSLINPFTNILLHFPLTPGQVANVPQGWWHYEIATTDNTHLLAIFDAPTPDTIFGSDILRLTPANVLAHTYCLNQAKVKDTLAPIQDTVVIGPPCDCQKQEAAGASKGMPQQKQSYINAMPANQSYFNQTYGQPLQPLPPNQQPSYSQAPYNPY